MRARATVTKRVRGGASRAKGAGEASFERLTQSVEAAEAALKDLRKELSKGTRDVLDDLAKTLGDARKNPRSVSRTVSKDLEQIQHALAAASLRRRSRDVGRRTKYLGVSPIGVVSLRGWLERDAQITQLVRATEAIDGVRTVNNLLHTPRD